MRHVFSAQMAPIIPVKRTRDRYVAKLVSAPPPPPTMEQQAGVYVLKLEDGTYYVGESTNTDVRVAQHKAGQGAAFTAVLGPTAVRVPPLTSGSAKDLEAWERIETLERMHRHGVEKVRGWLYTTPVMSPDQREEAVKQICTRKGLCCTCGRYGHFTAQCFANTKAAWASAACI